jgi:AcrR family transcriptional regulator
MTTEEANGRRRSHSKDERRAQLLKAARAVFGDKGYHAATVDDITRAAGVAKGTYYLYFSEKRTVFYELIGRFFEMVTEAGMSVAIAEVKTAEDFFTRLERAARRLARLFSENRDLVRLTYRESMGMDEKLEKMVRNFYRQMAQVEAENVRLGVKLGLFREDVHPLLAAYAHIGMVERVLLQWVSDRAFPEVPDLVHQLIELAYRGMQRSDGAR